MATPNTPTVTIGTADSGVGSAISTGLPGMVSVLVQNTSAETIFLFGTTTTGFPLLKGLTVELKVCGAVVASSASGNATTACLEVFN